MTGWHTAGDLLVPENLSLVFFPPSTGRIAAADFLSLRGAGRFD